MKSFAIAVGRGVQLDASKLVDGCALIQGTRGSGKSYLARVIVEQTIDEGLQTIVLDPEGEFVTLREKYDVIIAGKGGDVPCETRSAKLLARRIAETGASTVVDLSDLDLEDRRAFVRIFLDQLDSLPKRLERARIVVLDEAHKYCPEAGKGKAQSTEAVVTLMSQGRKRGIGAILVTQRLSKLRKDAAAEAANIFIGRTSPIDLGRAQDVLGCMAKDREKLRSLEPGEFYADGPGLSKRGVVAFKSSRAKTSHPQPGSRHRMSTPPPRKVISKLLKEFSTLPPSKEAEEAATAEEAKAEVRRLKREMTKLEREAGVEQRKLEHDQDAIDQIVATERAAGESLLVELDEKWRELWIARGNAIQEATGMTVPVFLDEAFRQRTKGRPKPAPDRGRPRPTPRVPRPASQAVGEAASPNGKVPGGKFRSMLTALAQHGELTRKQLGLHVGMSARGGGFNNYLGHGKKLGLWVIDGGVIAVTDAGLVEAGDFKSLPTGAALVEHWCQHQKVTGKARDILRLIVEAGETGIDRETLADAVEMSASGGGFNNYLGVLRTLDLISRTAPFVAAEELR